MGRMERPMIVRASSSEIVCLNGLILVGTYVNSQLPTTNSQPLPPPNSQNHEPPTTNHQPPTLTSTTAERYDPAPERSASPSRVAPPQVSRATRRLPCVRPCQRWRGSSSPPIRSDGS